MINGYPVAKLYSPYPKVAILVNEDIARFLGDVLDICTEWNR